MIRVYPKNMDLGAIVSDIRIVRAADGRQVVMSGREYVMNKHRLAEVVEEMLAHDDRSRKVSS